MSGVVNEASSLPSRSSQFRGAQSKTGIQEPGAFAALMESNSEPAPKPAQKADKPAPRHDSNDQTAATPVSTPDESKASTAADAAPVDGKSKPADAGSSEAANTLEPSAVSTAETSVDSTIAVVVPATVDPNAAVVPAIPVAAAPVSANTEAPAGLAEKPAAIDGATAPLAPLADAGETGGKTDGKSDGKTDVKTEGKTESKNEGRPVSQAKAPHQNPDGSTDQGAENEAASADASQPHKSPKPLAAPQDADRPQQDARDKPLAEAAPSPDNNAPIAKAGVEPAPLTSPVAVHVAAATVNHSPSAPAIVSQPIPVHALAVEIAGQARAGNSRFEIRLDPAELGRIDVRLDIDRDGNVSSRLVIERADTYDLLRRDQSTLERALQQAGLKTSDNALEFQLRDQGLQDRGFGRQQQDDTPAGNTKILIADADASLTEAANGYSRLLRAGNGIDIRV